MWMAVIDREEIEEAKRDARFLNDTLRFFDRYQLPWWTQHLPHRLYRRDGGRGHVVRFATYHSVGTD